MRVRYPFPKLVPASGGGIAVPYADKSIRFVRHGCRNRPFYYISVFMKRRNQYDQSIEQLGSFDPLLNQNNERLCSLNIERIQYWFGEGATVSKPVSQLLGLAGLLPIHPLSYMKAWRNRKKQKEAIKTEEEEKESSSAA
ncbi:mitochondrial ribosomal protein S16 [Lycorma delicatula]|uniref:mitochondrial ribosomal protein S16 n=1 Tax=Lycorma delicatula TaxID=130591 RepID=UPI003F513460